MSLRTLPIENNNNEAEFYINLNSMVEFGVPFNAADHVTGSDFILSIACSLADKTK